MKPYSRMVCALVLAVLVLPGTVPSAHAKGPVDVTISGPGITELYLGITEHAGVSGMTLGGATRVHHIWGQKELRPTPAALTREELGPRYVLAWWLGDTDVVQHAYPFADGGAWVLTPSGQRIGDSRVTSGWTRAPGLRAQLVALGAVVPGTPPPSTEALAEASAAGSAEPSAPAEDGDARSAYVVAASGGALLAALLLGGLALRRRARRAPAE